MSGAVQAQAKDAESLKCEKKDDLIRDMQQQLSTAALETRNLHIIKAQEHQRLAKDLQALQDKTHNQHSKVCHKSSSGCPSQQLRRALCHLYCARRDVLP